jgi:hypothetical protein
MAFFLDLSEKVCLQQREILNPVQYTFLAIINYLFWLI